MKITLSFVFVANIPPTDHAKIAAQLAGKPYRSAFPRLLPARVLRSIVRDLRQVERVSTVVSPDHSLLAGPLVLAAHIFRGRTLERQLELPSALSEAVLARVLPVYQFVVERELVTRVVGTRVYGDEEALVGAVDGEIDRIRADAVRR